jgi:hypothetical protein
MYLSPHVILSGRLYAAPEGVAGIRTTTAIMRQMVNEWRTDPRMVSAARNIVFLEPAKDEESEARAIFRFMQDRIRYVRDVLNVETVATPLATLRTRSGDCDDHVALMATLLEAIGFPTRFVVTGYEQPEVYEHVYLQVLVNGQWVSADSTEPDAFGWEAPDAVAIMVERV